MPDVQKVEVVVDDDGESRVKIESRPPQGAGCVKGCALFAAALFNLVPLCLAFMAMAWAHITRPALNELFKEAALPAITANFLASVNYLWMAPAALLLLSVVMARANSAPWGLIALNFVLTGLTAVLITLFALFGLLTPMWCAIAKIGAQ